MPVCDFVIASAGLGPFAKVNVTVTVSAALMVTVHVGGVVWGLGAMQLALKPANVEPEFAVAVSTT